MLQIPGLNKNVQFVLQVILSIFTLGAIYIVNNQAAVITAFSIIIAYAVNLLGRMKGVKIGRGWLTVLIYFVALLIAYLTSPTALPPFGTVPNNPALLVNAIVLYIPQLIAMLSPYAAGAMAIYNILLKSVLDQLVGEIVLDESTLA